MDLHALCRPPALLGFSPDRLANAEAMLQNGVTEQLYSAVSYVIMRHGLIAAMGAYGVPQPDAEPPILASLDTIFDLASLTKPFTATLLLQCVEEGLLHLNQEVRHHLLQSENTPVGSVTLQSLATHTSGLPAWKPVGQSENGSPLAQILATPLDTPTGTHYTYSDLGYILLGYLLEQVTQQTLDALVQERIFKPLGMSRSGFHPLSNAASPPSNFPSSLLAASPTASLHATMAATGRAQSEEDTRANMSRYVGEVHDPNAHGMGGIAGHAGLFSNAPDMVRFILSFWYQSRLREDGNVTTLDLPLVLNPLARRLAATCQTDPLRPDISAHTIGWFAHPNGYLPKGDLFSNQTFGHTGFTGTILMFDPHVNVTLLLLTNRVVYEKEKDGTTFLRMRRLFANSVAGAIL